VNRPTLTIVLSTYNGAKFLADQVDSIQRQTFTDWELVLRDDGSSDGTQKLAESLAAREPRITILHDSRGNLGPVGSFGLLLEHARNTGATYVALADQDDVWRGDKLEREFALLQRREREVGLSVPLLVHSDLTVVSEDLRLIHPSYRGSQHLQRVSGWPLGTLLIQNFVTGCTTLINRALLQAALPIPNAAVMHDWWLALVAAALGELLYVSDPMVLYRQHGANTVGIRGWLPALWASLRRPVTWWRHSAVVFGQSFEQSKALKSRLEREARPSTTGARSLEILRDYCAAFETGGAVDRLRALHRHRIRPVTLLPFPVRFYLRSVSWSEGHRPGGTPQ
jgi:rhamnosyltransferase